MNRYKTKINLQPNSNGFETFHRTKSKVMCRYCQTYVDLMTYPQAANFCFSTPAKILKLANRGKIHRLHNRKGEVMICQNSLKTYIENSRKISQIILYPIPTVK